MPDNTPVSRSGERLLHPGPRRRRCQDTTSRSRAAVDNSGTAIAPGVPLADPMTPRLATTVTATSTPRERVTGVPAWEHSAEESARRSPGQPRSAADQDARPSRRSASSGRLVNRKSSEGCAQSRQVRSRSGLSVALRDDRWLRPSREIRRRCGFRNISVSHSMRAERSDLVCRDLFLRGPPPVRSTMTWVWAVRRTWNFPALAVAGAVAQAVSLASTATNREQRRAEASVRGPPCPARRQLLRDVVTCGA